jgi:predicted acylesterase/phospholipase RssA
MMSRRSLIATAVLLTALAGCSGSNIRNADETFPNGLPGSTPTRWHIDPNCAGRPVSTREDLAKECPDPTAHDFISIALSGGGTKAAIFSAETMFYLQALGVLPRTSVVSSVSGGSFAAAVYAISCDPADAVCLNDRPHTLKRPVWEHDAVLTNMGQGYGKVVREQLARLLVPALGPEVTANRFADIIDSDYLGGGLGDGGRFLFRDVNPRRPHLFLNATITTENRGGLESVSNGPGCTPLVSRGHLRRRTPDEFFHFAFTDFYFGLLRSRVDNYPLSAGVAASAAFPALIANATLDDHCADAANNKILLMDGGANDNQALVEIYMVLAELVYGQHRSDLWNQPGKLEKLNPAGDRAWIFVVNSSVTEATGPSASGGGAQPRGDIGFFLNLVGRVLDATDVYSAEGYNLRKQLYLAERDRFRNVKGFAPLLPVEI